MNKLLKELKTLGVAVVKTTPADEMVDAAIDLGGKYDGMHIQVGKGYYEVVKETDEGSFIFLTGKGDLAGELERSFNETE